MTEAQILVMDMGRQLDQQWAALREDLGTSGATLDDIQALYDRIDPDRGLRDLAPDEMEYVACLARVALLQVIHSVNQTILEARA